MTCRQCLAGIIYKSLIPFELLKEKTIDDSLIPFELRMKLPPNSKVVTWFNDAATVPHPN
jgi:hypothetical protein